MHGSIAQVHLDTHAAAIKKQPEKWNKERAAQFLNARKDGWFASLQPGAQRYIIERCEIISFKRNALICRADDQADGIHAVLEGDVRAFVRGEGGESIFFRCLGPGSWTGISPILDGSMRRTKTLRANSPAVTLFLDRTAVETLAADRDGLAALVGLMFEINAEFSRLAIEARSDATVRTARALLRVAKAHGRYAGNFAELDIRLSQADLASMVGVSRQYMNELIARWEKDEILQWRSSGRHRLNWALLSGMLDEPERNRLLGIPA